jgi:DNA-binding protein YbaB
MMKDMDTQPHCSADQLFCLISNLNPLSRIDIETLLRDDQGKEILESLVGRPVDEAMQVIEVILKNSSHAKE